MYDSVRVLDNSFSFSATDTEAKKIDASSKSNDLSDMSETYLVPLIVSVSYIQITQIHSESDVIVQSNYSLRFKIPESESFVDQVVSEITDLIVILCDITEMKWDHTRGTMCANRINDGFDRDTISVRRRVRTTGLTYHSVKKNLSGRRLSMYLDTRGTYDSFDLETACVATSFRIVSFDVQFQLTFEFLNSLQNTFIMIPDTIYHEFAKRNTSLNHLSN